MAILHHLVVAARKSEVRLVVGWVVIWLAGISFVARHDALHGLVGRTVDAWPQDSKLARTNNQSQLLLFAHPSCPCTKATLKELIRIVSTSTVTLEISVVLSGSTDVLPEWKSAAALLQRNNVHRVKLISDSENLEARRFGAKTSGHIFFYTATGQLLFNGGITTQRGHEGWSKGGLTLRDQLQAKNFSTVEAPVFGCPI